MDVAEISRPLHEELAVLQMTQLLTDRITAIARSLLGSNRSIDVITYPVNDTQGVDYMAELIEHTGPRDARAMLHGRGGSRNAALWLLFDRAERELNVTMSQVHAEKGMPVINTRRLGSPR